jgi:hypothetical protein
VEEHHSSSANSQNHSCVGMKQVHTHQDHRGIGQNNLTEQQRYSTQAFSSLSALTEAHIQDNSKIQNTNNITGNQNISIFFATSMQDITQSHR